MRKLRTIDVFSAMRILQKANLKEELKPFIKKVAEGKSTLEDVGIEGILTVIEILSEKKAESAIYEFLANPFEMTPKEVENLELSELSSNLCEMAKENDIKAFFTSLSSLITLK